MRIAFSLMPVFRALSSICDGTFLEEIVNGFCKPAVENLTVVPHYPRKNKYRQNIPKNGGFFVNERKIYLGP